MSALNMFIRKYLLGCLVMVGGLSLMASCQNRALLESITTAEKEKKALESALSTVKKEEGKLENKLAAIAPAYEEATKATEKATKATEKALQKTGNQGIQLLQLIARLQNEENPEPDFKTPTQQSNKTPQKKGTGTKKKASKSAKKTTWTKFQGFQELAIAIKEAASETLKAQKLATEAQKLAAEAQKLAAE